MSRIARVSLAAASLTVLGAIGTSQAAPLTVDDNSASTSAYLTDIRIDSTILWSRDLPDKARRLNDNFSSTGNLLVMQDGGTAYELNIADGSTVNTRSGVGDKSVAEVNGRTFGDDGSGSWDSSNWASALNAQPAGNYDSVSTNGAANKLFTNNTRTAIQRYSVDAAGNVTLDYNAALAGSARLMGMDYSASQGGVYTIDGNAAGDPIYFLDDTTQTFTAVTGYSNVAGGGTFLNESVIHETILGKEYLFASSGFGILIGELDSATNIASWDYYSSTSLQGNNANALGLAYDDGVLYVAFNEGGNGFVNDVVAFNVTAIPEPASAMLMGLGGVLLAMRRR